MVFLLKPLIVPVNLLSRLISRGGPSSEITRAEIKNFIRLGYFQGIIESDEFQIVDNVLKLKSVMVRDVMTPRSVVFTLSQDETAGELQKKNIIMHFSRIPLRDNEGHGITVLC